MFVSLITVMLKASPGIRDQANEAPCLAALDERVHSFALISGAEEEGEAMHLLLEAAGRLTEDVVEHQPRMAHR